MQPRHRERPEGWLGEGDSYRNGMIGGVGADLIGQELGRRPSCGRVAWRRGHGVWSRAVKDVTTPGKQRIITTIAISNCQACTMRARPCTKHFTGFISLIFTIAPGHRLSSCAPETEALGGNRCPRSHVTEWQSFRWILLLLLLLLIPSAQRGLGFART